MEERTHRFADFGIDWDPTVKRFCGDLDLLDCMLREFAEEDLIEGLPPALARADYGEVERIAHAAKGTSANLGLVEVSALCDDVVQAVRAGDCARLEELVGAAVNRYRIVRQRIAEL